MDFPSPAGWHVLIGDNGAGKTTVLRAIAVGLMGASVNNIVADWENWIRRGKEKSEIIVDISPERDFEPAFHSVSNSTQTKLPDHVACKIDIKQDPSTREYKAIYPHNTITPESPYMYNWGSHSRWFSAGFGARRILSGGTWNWDLNADTPQLRPLNRHITLLHESADLRVSIVWLIKMQFDKYAGKKTNIDGVITFINSNELLPYNTQIKEVTSDGVLFSTNTGDITSITQLSDGVKSTITLVLEILRLLTEAYAQDTIHGDAIDIFKTDENGNVYVNVPGVVLIDEIDAHLHPSWQTKIGEWFTRYFPKMQFIVTTHSPLICRACERGSIWRLAAPGSGLPSGQITGIDKERLVYGNILDAYGTEVFGEEVVRSEKSDEKLERLGHLSILSALGKATEEEEQERIHLQAILSTDDPTGR
jgi:energy-coupling factor transporter ATP-binding protein EcfA2